MSRALGVLLLLMGCVTALPAQQAPLIPLGVRLRVTTGAPARVQTGTNGGIASGLLVLNTPAGVSSIALPDIHRLERSRGRRPGLAGGIVGFLLGGAVGGVAGCAANRDSYGVFCGGQSDTKVVVGAAAGGLAGAALGALLFKRESWELVAPQHYRGTAR